MAQPLLIQVENYVKDFLKGETFEGRPFHNIDHTIHVVSKCHELATYYNITEADKETLITAAWFHDTGYRYSDFNHEKESVKIAFTF